MYFVIDENNNKIPAYSAEEVLAVLNKAIADGSLANIVADAAFISRVKCCVSGYTHLFAFVTQAKYNELKENNQLVNNCYYFITDDTAADEINNRLEQIIESLNEITPMVDKMPKRVYEYTGTWFGGAGVSQVDVSSRGEKQKGFYKVTFKLQGNFYALDLPALNGSYNIVNYGGETIGMLQLSGNKISVDTAKTYGIFAVDYYEAV